MITAIVQFTLPKAVTLHQAQVLFEQSAPQFQNLPGLIRKYFLRSEDGQTIGGVYLWRTRQDAECFYNSGFKQLIREKFGCEPTIVYFESPVIVDNSAMRMKMA